MICPDFPSVPCYILKCWCASHGPRLSPSCCPKCIYVYIQSSNSKSWHYSHSPMASEQPNTVFPGNLPCARWHKKRRRLYLGALKHILGQEHYFIISYMENLNPLISFFLANRRGKSHNRYLAYIWKIFLLHRGIHHSEINGTPRHVGKQLHSFCCIIIIWNADIQVFLQGLKKTLAQL